MTKMTKTKRSAYQVAVDKVVMRCHGAPHGNRSLFDCVVEELHGGGPLPTAAQSKIIESATHKSRGRVNHATRTVEPDETSATELKLFIDNDADLYRQQGLPILKNLATKKVRSLYKHDLAAKLYGHLVESGAKKYAKEFSVGTDWHKMFDVPTRKLVAEELTRAFENEFETGNYDELLPKKYQKELQKKHLVPPHRYAHARKAKSMADYEAEGYKAHTWYVADAPYSQPKIRDAWQRGAWKWQQEQRALRPAKVGTSHATRKSKTQLDREIAHVVPSWRAGR